ncbi:MAG: flagellin [bacterium]
MAINPLTPRLTGAPENRLKETEKRNARDAAQILAPEQALDSASIGQQTRLTNRLRGISQQLEGVQLGIGVAQTADAALQSATDDFQAVRDLTLQAANGTTSQADREAIQSEIDQRLAAADDALTGARFNGQPVFGQSRTVSVGSQGHIPVEYPELSVRLLTGGTVDGAQYSIPKIDKALDTLAAVRAQGGATQNRLTRSLDELRSAASNVAAASANLGPNLLDSVAQFKLDSTQFKVALKATAAQLQTSDAVLELLR